MYRNSIDFSKTLIHCSSLSKITTEPRSKADKDAGNLSETAKTHLIEVYAEKMYGFRRDNSNKYTNKGNVCEPKAISELSKFTGLRMEKNEGTVSNDWFIGTPDVRIDSLRIIFDTKCCYDWITLLENLPDGPDDENIHQIEGYLDCLEWDKGYVAKILLDHPEEDIDRERYRLFTQGNYISEESPEFLRKWAEKEKMFRFEQFPLDARILLFEVNANSEYIDRAKLKVEKSRKFLQEFSEKHINFNKSLTFNHSEAL